MVKSIHELFFNCVILGIFILAAAMPGYANTEESLEIHCAKDTWIKYSDVNYLNYEHYKPTIYGYGYEVHGPWIDKHINCYEGHIKVTYRIKDSYGQWHYCYTKIWVENDTYHQSNIEIECPYDEWIFCDDLHYYQFKKPKVHSYDHYEIFGPWKEKHLNSCGIGHIKVSWKIVDQCGRERHCEYLVKVKGHHSGSPIKYWPADFWTDECEADLDPKHLGEHYGTPHISNGGECSDYGISYKDEIFYPVASGYNDKPDFCYKILRTWSVIDWCNYDGYSNGYGNSYGKWSHTQLIKVKGGSTPTIECPEDVTVSVEGDESTAFVDLADATASLSDGSCSDKLHITNDSKYADHHGADASGHYPFGEHWVTFKVADGCHNHTTCKVKITVKDLHAPTPYCHSKIVTDIGWHDDGLYTEIKPGMFDAGSYDNVTPNHKLTFRIEPPILYCDDIGTNDIKIFVIDEFGNENFCTAKLILQDNLGMCPQDSAELASAAISGSIMTEGGMAVSQAVVSFEGEGMISTMTSEEGTFNIRLSKDQGYSIKPQKDIHFTDGVNILDYITLHNYVSGNVELNSPYKMIAADIDGSGIIDAMDVFKLGSMILNKGQDMPEGAKSWRFVDANYKFPDPKDPLHSAFPESQNIEMLIDEMNAIDFIGIKIGDVDGTLSAPIGTLRSSAKNGFDLEIETSMNQKGELLVSTKNALKVLGSLITFDLNGAEVIGLNKSAQISVDNGVASILWIGMDAKDDVIELFTLRNKVAKVELSKIVVESVDLNYSQSAGNVKTDLVMNNSFNLYQNRPNPFTNQTIIPFDLFEAGNVSITIQDIAGKIIWKSIKTFQPGFHQIAVDASQFKMLGGLYYYTIQTEAEQTTQRMVFIK